MLNQTNAMNTETWVGNIIGKNTENKNIKIAISHTISILNILHYKEFINSVNLSKFAIYKLNIFELFVFCIFSPINGISRFSK